MRSSLTHSDIHAVRDASRKMVRALGFMRPTLADTDLSPSAVHALVEIGQQVRLTAHRLSQILLLEKSSVSRMLARLIARGLIMETPDAADGRLKNLDLTAAGLALLGDIDRYANLQVATALHALPDHSRQVAVNGLKAYAQGLEMARSSPSATQLHTESVDVVEGFAPGALGRIAEMHGCYYADKWKFPPVFEAKVAAGLAEFVPIWLAVQAGRIVGSAALDGEDLGQGAAHLRWVIVDDAARGSGAGRKLVESAVNFSDARSYGEIHLWTFRGLDAARKLYESFGFKLLDEWRGNQWGVELAEQRFVRRI
jgi:DNA-binding MarR family transcriptional regulator/GNAT superfamily N-acetyltransferase